MRLLLISFSEMVSAQWIMIFVDAANNECSKVEIARIKFARLKDLTSVNLLLFSMVFDQSDQEKPN